MNRLTVFFVSLIATPLFAIDAKEDVLRDLDSRLSNYSELAREIWELAEVGYQETESCLLLQNELKSAGFTVEAGVAGMPTAFVASYGQGKPVIGLLAEFDALPGLSQESLPERSPRTMNAPGHA